MKKLISKNRLPHLLFCGPPGTGKTSTILACAREMYGDAYKTMVLELNASDDRGINVVRDQIKSFASTRRLFSSGVKLIVLDEADAMTNAAQMALRRVVEKYASNARFCFICNYVNRIIPALQSRCTRFRFGPVAPEDVKKRLEEIIDVEGVDITDDGVDAILTLASGDMRKVLNVLQSTHMAVRATGGGKVTMNAVYANTGAPHPKDIENIFGWLLNDGFTECATKLLSLKTSRGIALQDIVQELLEFVIVNKQLSQKAKVYIYQQLADIEYRMSRGGSEKLNTAALVGAFGFTSALSMQAMAT